MADCCTRLANKINAARSTNPLIWTALMHRWLFSLACLSLFSPSPLQADDQPGVIKNATMGGRVIPIPPAVLVGFEFEGIGIMSTL
jgi:hypothetical protein